MAISDKKNIKKYYQNEICAQKYVKERFTFPLGKILHEKQVSVINRYILLTSSKKILELACGPGRITQDVEVPANVKCVAVDASDEMLKIAKEKLQGKKHWILRKEDIFLMELGERFDLIYSFRFVRHFRKRDRIKIYETVKKHLLDKGIFIFDVVNKEISLPLRLREGLDRYPVYDKLYTREEFLKEMAKVGFWVKELIPVYPYYNLLLKIQIYLGPRFDKLTYSLLRFIENNFTKKNLEWIAVCQFA
ncbi:hypothetical protein JCM12298_16240 [Desulfothermus naphthae]